MGLRGKKLLILDDEAELAETIASQCTRLGMQADYVNHYQKFFDKLNSESYDFVLSDFHMPIKNGLQVLEEAKKQNSKVPIWIFMSADASPEVIEKVVRAGGRDIIQKPFRSEALKLTLERLDVGNQKPLEEIMYVVQSISGVQLPAEKEALVETRLLRRARLLGMSTLQEYLTFFRDNRQAEVQELISVMTTHTTEFFREPDHFDYLWNTVFPKIVKLKRDGSPIRIWSAACSTGQELYSIAICWNEWKKEHSSQHPNLPKVEFYGTDIDFKSVERSSDGVYHLSEIAGIQADLLKEYFDEGTDEHSEYYRICDSIHASCKFEQMNLLGSSFPTAKFDIVMLRNVLIYFNKENIQEIVKKMEFSLTQGGYLFVGHSESLRSYQHKLFTVGNSVYSREPAEDFKRNDSHSTVLATASDQVNRTNSKDHRSKSPIKVLVIDDSATIRMLLRKILSKENGFEIVGEAAHPLEAEKLLQSGIQSDVITLDIHMPEMDGVTYLEKLSKRQGVPPVVMLSSIGYEDAVNGLRCLELGAVEYIEKPSGSASVADEAERIQNVLRTAVLSRKKSFTNAVSKVSGDVQYHSSLSNDLFLLGASTGGVEALTSVIELFPDQCPPTLVVQHIPPHFSKAFADRLNERCKIEVKEASNGELVRSNTVYIAPGGRQMKLVKKPTGFMIEVNDDAPVNLHRPSVDYLFDSVIPYVKDYRIVAAILTGMGADGANGMKRLRDAGVHTIAQDEESCVVFGMPKEAIARGGVVEVQPLPSIAYHLFKALKQRKAA